MIPATWTQRWRSLAKRERLVLLGGGGVLVATIVFLTIIDPLLEYSDRLDRQAIRHARALAALTALRTEYADTQNRLRELEGRLGAPGPANRSLLAVLEDATGRANVRDRIASMQPQVAPAAQGYKETAVELRLDAVTWPQTLALLVKLEESPSLTQVRRLQVRPRFDAPHLLDTSMLVSTYERE